MKQRYLNLLMSATNTRHPQEEIEGKPIESYKKKSVASSLQKGKSYSSSHCKLKSTNFIFRFVSLSCKQSTGGGAVLTKYYVLLGDSLVYHRNDFQLGGNTQNIPNKKSKDAFSYSVSSQQKKPLDVIKHHFTATRPIFIEIPFTYSCAQSNG